MKRRIITLTSATFLLLSLGSIAGCHKRNDHASWSFAANDEAIAASDATALATGNRPGSQQDMVVLPSYVGSHVRLEDYLSAGPQKARLFKKRIADMQDRLSEFKGSEDVAVTNTAEFPYICLIRLSNDDWTFKQMMATQVESSSLRDRQQIFAHELGHCGQTPYWESGEGSQPTAHVRRVINNNVESRDILKQYLNDPYGRSLTSLYRSYREERFADSFSFALLTTRLGWKPSMALATIGDMRLTGVSNKTSMFYFFTTPSVVNARKILSRNPQMTPLEVATEATETDGFDSFVSFIQWATYYALNFNGMPSTNLSSEEGVKNMAELTRPYFHITSAER